jgi:hypothetical protein
MDEKTKASEFERTFRLLVSTSDLQTACNLAEECLTLLPEEHTFGSMPKLGKLQLPNMGNFSIPNFGRFNIPGSKRPSTHIDPVYTLLERLMSSGHYSAKADELSKHYVSLLDET